MTTLSANYLRVAALFVSTEETRYYLNGVLVEPRAGGATLVSTDGHRLFAAKDTHGEDNAPLFGALSIPFGVIKRALAPFRAADYRENVTVDLVEDEAGWTLGDVRFSPIDGTYPDWRRVIPSSTSGDTAQFNADYLATFAKAQKMLGSGIGDDRKSRYQPVVHHNGDGPALLDLGDANCIGVLVPFRAHMNDLTARSREITGNSANVAQAA